MKRKSKELKALARQALRGHYAIMISAIVLLGIFSGVLGLLPQTLTRSNSSFSLVLQFVVSVIIGVLTYLMELGIIVMILHMVRGQQFMLSDMLHAFRHQPDRFIIVGIIEILISAVLQLPADIIMYVANPNDLTLTLLSSILTLIAAILSLIITLGFALCGMLLIDNDDLGAIDSIRQSFTLMSGNKARLLYLEFSFIGLAFLCVLSFGLGFLWLMPYMYTTEVFFYLDVIGELDQPDMHDSDFNTYTTNNYSYDSTTEHQDYTFEG